ncbi:MAG TPA: extracellular solute-binding protein [Ktedonobacteraceae bacterium]|nr:extracellular solute-binding protein [Ktedonobacteraceae bacterium]
MVSRDILTNRPMNRRSFLTRSAIATGTLTGAGSLLAACGSTGSTGTGGSSSVTLKHLTWSRAYDAAAQDAVYHAFHAAHPNVTVAFENLPQDYETILKARFTSNDGPDIFGLNAPRADIQAMIDAGNLLELSDQPWVNDMYDSAKVGATYNGKIYGVTYLQYTWSVMYNTKVFADHNITPPTTYDEFLSICEKLKKAGIAPLALGLKDTWLSSYIPFSMAATAIYRENPQFDADLLAGRTTFAQSEWPKILNDYLDLQKRGYFQPSQLGTTYNQGLQLLVAGQAAMVLNGSWFIPDTRTVSPNLGLALFALPYKPGDTYLPVQPGEPWSIYNKTKHPTEAKQYLEYWANQAGAGAYLSMRGLLSALKSVTSKTDPALDNALPYIKSGKTISTVNMGGTWPTQVGAALTDGIQGLFANTTTVDQVIKNLDAAVQANKKS